MKPLLNPDKYRHIAFEDSLYLHKIISRDDSNKFYWTICEKPIAFEENYRIYNNAWDVHPLQKYCDICSPIQN